MVRHDLLKTPLHALHLELGAKMVAFAGYDMPVSYPAGIMAEHRHCRAAAALFDVSHMGQLRLLGDRRRRASRHLVPMDIAGLAVGKQRYAFFTNSSGGILDDLMVTRRENDLFVVVNAALQGSGCRSPQSHIGDRCRSAPCRTRRCSRCRARAPPRCWQRARSWCRARLTFMSGAASCSLAPSVT